MKIKTTTVMIMVTTHYRRVAFYLGWRLKSLILPTSQMYMQAMASKKTCAECMASVMKLALEVTTCSSTYSAKMKSAMQASDMRIVDE
jgi:hypothetical protein